jgi:hypothetical protein
MTMHIVLATRTVVVARAAGVPRAAEAVAMLRGSVCRLAPTAPFIGASSAPTLSADSSAEAALRANRRSPQRCSKPASDSWFSSAPMNAYSGKACSSSCSSRPTMQAGKARSNEPSKAPSTTPIATNVDDASSSTAYAGKPVATISANAMANIGSPSALMCRPRCVNRNRTPRHSARWSSCARPCTA